MPSSLNSCRTGVCRASQSGLQALMGSPSTPQSANFLSTVQNHFGTLERNSGARLLFPGGGCAAPLEDSFPSMQPWSALTVLRYVNARPDAFHDVDVVKITGRRTI